MPRGKVKIKFITKCKACEIDFEATHYKDNVYLLDNAKLYLNKELKKIKGEA